MLACGPATSPDAPETATPATGNPETEEMAGQETEAPMTSRGMETSTTEAPGETGPMEAIRKGYARIEAALKAGALHKDSILYRCEDAMVEGQIDLYEDDGGVVLAVHGFSMGDHSGTTEHYYFQGGKPIFLFRESGVWRFGGPMVTMDDGTDSPGTIDNITEDRLYFNEGSTIKALTKAYELINGEGPDPATVPNETMAHNGELPESLEVVQSVIATRKVDCKLVEEL